MKKIKNSKFSITPYLMIAPLMVGLIVFCYYPPVYGAVMAFFDDYSIAKGTWEFIGVSNFINLFKTEEFVKSFLNMVIIQTPRLISGVVTPLIYAEIIFHLSSKKSQAVYRFLVLLPIVAPGVVGTLVWKQIYQTNGLFNVLLQGVGILREPISWLNNADFVVFAILFMGFPWIGGSQVLIYLAGLMNIPKDLFEAADLDGASAWNKIFKIHIFLISGQIRYFLIFGLINGLQDYGTQVVLMTDNTRPALLVPGFYMYEKIGDLKPGTASAVGLILFVIIMVITIIFYKFVRFGDSKDD